MLRLLSGPLRWALSARGREIANIADPTADDSAASKHYVDTAIAAVSGAELHIDDAIADTAPGANLVTRSAQKIAALIAAAVATLTRYALNRAALAANAATGVPCYLSGEGWFVYSTANLSAAVTADTQQGIYVAPAGQDGSTGAWVRQYSGAVNVKWFGAKGDGVTNDGPAIIAAIAFLKSIAGNPINTFYKASGELFIPQGKYYCGTNTIEITHTFTIRGEGGGGFGAGGGAATELFFDDGTTGIRIQEYNTSGVSTVDPSPFHFTGSCTMLKGLYLHGGYAGAESESHGIHSKTKLILDDVVADNFGGDALYVHTTNGAGSPNEGNSNCSRAYNCHFRNSRDGLSITGGDANAWLFLGCFFDYNRRWGVNDTCFLGNTYVGCHQDSNGITGNSAGFGASVVSYSGNRYACVYNQEANASINAPSGNTTDTAYWYYLAAGGVGGGGLYIPAWVSGMTVRAGGPMLLFNGNQNSVVTGNYVEGGQGQIQQTGLGIVFGGSNNTGVRGGSWLRGWTGGYFRTSPQITVGNFQQWQRSGESFIIDGSQDATSLANVALTLKTGIASTGSGVITFLKSDGSNMGKLSCVANFGLIADGLLGVWLRFNAVDTANVNSTGFNVATGKTLQMGGTVVVDSSRNGSFVAVTATGNITTSAGLVGYGAGAGGTVAQATSKGTAVTLNKSAGAITLMNDNIAANGLATFTFNNSQIGADDHVHLRVRGGAATPGSYLVQAEGKTAGVRTITVRNLTAAGLAEALELGFLVFKGTIA